jgi:hypothetical protein
MAKKKMEKPNEKILIEKIWDLTGDLESCKSLIDEYYEYRFEYERLEGHRQEAKEKFESHEAYLKYFQEYHFRNRERFNQQLQERRDKKREAIYKSTFLTLNGETRSAYEWATIKGLSCRNILYRINRGWSVERTLNTPVLYKAPHKAGIE